VDRRRRGNPSATSLYKLNCFRVIISSEGHCLIANGNGFCIRICTMISRLLKGGHRPPGRIDFPLHENQGSGLRLGYRRMTVSNTLTAGEFKVSRLNRLMRLRLDMGEPRLTARKGIDA
jgi:hypothetical protein